MCPIFAVSHKVITLIVKYHLIGLTSLIKLFVQLFISVFIIIMSSCLPVSIAPLYIIKNA